MTRAIGVLARVGSALAVGAAALVELGWLAGRVASDRTLLTQWLSWIPPAFAAAAILFLLSLSWTLARFGRRAPRRSVRASGLAWTRRFVLLFALLAGAWVLVADLRLLAPASGLAPAGRIVFWNPSGADLEPMPDPIARLGPDILVMANPNRRRWTFDIASAIGSASGGPAHVAFGVQLACVSRDPILAWGATDLGLHGRISRKAWITADDEPDTGGIDRGRAMYVLIDATRWIGRPITVWIVDLPSDAGLPRPAMMSQARLAIDDFAGPEYRADSDGRWVARGVRGGFPPADVIVGDLNTPRGSASISRLVGPLRDAWDSGGRGLVATWPRRLPLWHIDHAFLRPELECVGYRAIDLGRAEHRAIAVDVAALRREPGGPRARPGSPPRTSPRG